MKTIYHSIYNKLLKLAPELWSLEPGDALKSKVSGYMDLNLDILNKTEKYLIIALSHYYKHHSGDMIPDPDMTIKVSRDGFAEALTYQDFFGYKQVYLSENKFYPSIRKDLNNFLNGLWLKNCIEQGHFLKNNH